MLFNSQEFLIFFLTVFTPYWSFNKNLNKKNLNYYDWTNLFKENNNLDYWKDKTHLSNEGAELFTEKVAKNLIFNLTK